MLRHDVDVDPACALLMARLEASLGVRSCFLFQLTGPFYNACSASCLNAVADLRRLGHEIGLHFSEYHYTADGKGGLPPRRLEDLVDREARLFGEVHGLRSGSCHSTARRRPC